MGDDGAVMGQGKSPQTAINGFIAAILVLLLSLVYLCWTSLPETVLHSLHITYYPNRYWAVAAPAMLVMIFYYYFTTSACLVLIATHPLDDGRCITDVDSKEDTQVMPGALSKVGGSVPPWVDIPVPVCSKLLYLPWK